jgi:hypothetical protein
MTVSLPSLRNTLIKLLQGTNVDGLVQNAGATSPATPVYTNQQAQAEVQYAGAVRQFTFTVTDASTAATAIAEQPVFCVDPSLTNGIQILRIEASFQTAFSASATVYGTFTFKKRTNAGAGTTVAVNSTNTTDAVFGAAAGSNAFQPYAMTAPVTTSSASSLAAGTDCLTFTMAKASTGTAFGVVSFTVFYLEA